MNAFVMFIARIAAFAISNAVEERNRPLVRMLATIAFEIALSFLGMMVVAYFSRLREFRADAGGAKFAGRERMISALEALKSAYEPKHHDEQPAIASLKISGHSGGLMALLSTHPPLEERIRQLRR